MNNLPKIVPAIITIIVVFPLIIYSLYVGIREGLQFIGDPPHLSKKYNFFRGIFLLLAVILTIFDQPIYCIIALYSSLFFYYKYLESDTEKNAFFNSPICYFCGIILFGLLGLFIYYLIKPNYLIAIIYAILSIPTSVFCIFLFRLSKSKDEFKQFQFDKKAYLLKNLSSYIFFQLSFFLGVCIILFFFT